MSRLEEIRDHEIEERKRGFIYFIAFAAVTLFVFVAVLLSLPR